MDQRLVATEHEFVDDLFPLVGVIRQRVLEEVDVGPLVCFVAEEISPVIVGDLGGRLFPWLELLRFGLVDILELAVIRAQQIRRRKNVCRVVIELEVVVDYGMVDVVGPQQVLEASCSPVMVGLDIVNFDRGDVDGLRLLAVRDEEVDDWDIREQTRRHFFASETFKEFPLLEEGEVLRQSCRCKLPLKTWRDPPRSVGKVTFDGFD